MVESAKHSVMKILKGLEHLSCEDRLKELGLLRLEKRRLWGISSMPINTRREPTASLKSQPCTAASPGAHINTDAAGWTGACSLTLTPKEAFFFILSSFFSPILKTDDTEHTLQGNNNDLHNRRILIGFTTERLTNENSRGNNMIQLTGQTITYYFKYMLLVCLPTGVILWSAAQYLLLFPKSPSSWNPVTGSQRGLFFLLFPLSLMPSYLQEREK